ncbi:unnamed protein product [Plutella xylostella]|uniref:(diamondback moth) hypothetical protein n=1 Tax=Plutella xylostella TaxID=51655 RepID=A0A8S4FGI5_PLUXY|nr:unnamed protein product [Plutella xylostella]
MRVLDCVSGGGGKLSGTASGEVFTINTASDSSLNIPRADLESQSTVTNTKSSPGCRLCWRLCIDVPIVVLGKIYTIFFFFLVSDVPTVRQRQKQPNHKACEYLK